MTTKLPMRVLLIEDGKTDAEYMKAVLTSSIRYEYKVALVTTAEAAALLLKKSGVDLIILDMYLEKISGVPAIKLVREFAPFTPLVVLTSSEDYYRAIPEAFKAGADDYIIKGKHSMDDLRHLLREAIDNKAARLAMQPAKQIMAGAKEQVKQWESEPGMPPWDEDTDLPEKVLESAKPSESFGSDDTKLEPKK